MQSLLHLLSVVAPISSVVLPMMISVNIQKKILLEDTKK